jgi:hypothetical protein
VPYNDKFYSIEFQQSFFDYADATRRLMQQKLHVLLQMRALARPSANASSRSLVFCTRNDVMCVTTLNQIFGTLAVTATLCGAETARAQNYPYRPCC